MILQERVARAQATQYQLQHMNQQLQVEWAVLYCNCTVLYCNCNCTVLYYTVMQVERADKYRLLDYEQRTSGLYLF